MDTPLKRILVVDHEPEMRAQLVEHLQGWGYQTETAETASEALALIPRQRPDLVILDVEMPDQDGYLVCTKLKRFSRERIGRIPVILCSVRTSERDRHFGRYAGADDYMAKPFDWPRLAQRLQVLLARLPLPPES